jgi:hypothetical protein
MNKCKEAGIEPVNRHDYIKILDYYAGRVVDRIINKGQRWDIPCNLGTVQVVACPRTDRPNIDWSHFNETEEIAYHMPIGTNKYLYKVLWARPLKRQHHIQNYKFNFARPLRGILVDAIKSGLNYELIR